MAGLKMELVPDGWGLGVSQNGTIWTNLNFGSKLVQRLVPAPQKVSHAKMTNWAGLNEVSQTTLTNFVSISKKLVFRVWLSFSE